MEKQNEKAKGIIKSPSKSKKIKFIKTTGEQIDLNQALIEKSKKTTRNQGILY